MAEKLLPQLIHPWIQERDIDLPDESPLWMLGENAAADAIIFNASKPEVLLIQRPEGTWANPGGFVDVSDATKAHTAAREAYEEAGVMLDPNEALPIYEGIVSDRRASKYSWVTTAAFLWRTSLQFDQLVAGDDAKGIRLAELADIPALQLSGSHNALIEQAVQKYGTILERLRYYESASKRTPNTGGHMEYDRYTSELPNGEKVFVKQYSPNKYTDTSRADRSLLYLQKEAELYEHLSTAGFNSIPAEAGYCDGTLAMSALSEQDGWSWKPPKQPELQQQYITDTLLALDSLSNVPAHNDTIIKPSFVSFAEEGWDSYCDNNKQLVINKLYDYARTVKNDDLSDAAYKLVDDLDRLHAMFRAVEYDQPAVLCHHDFRASNFAWHPENGVRIIDWSWAGPGLKNSDATTFLIDLHKRGADIANYINSFNKDHALTMIGFWLMHSTWPSNNSDDVRFQQVHSAVAAYDLFVNN